MSRIFGAVRQNGYVVKDIETAMDHWINVMAVGPWYYIKRVKTDYFRYRGADTPAEMSIALANSGDLQIGGQQGRFCYFDTEAHPGTFIEISDISGTKGKFFEKIRQVAASWDGSRPIRVVE
ncbi:MAG: hypothetical protein ACJAX5_003380 [Patiriisocius sp.]